MKLTLQQIQDAHWREVIRLRKERAEAGARGVQDANLRSAKFPKKKRKPKAQFNGYPIKLK
jgi:hypothetical protein